LEHIAALWQFLDLQVWKCPRKKSAQLSKIHFCRRHPGSGDFEVPV
jgi:hypothetical protein